MRWLPFLLTAVVALAPAAERPASPPGHSPSDDQTAVRLVRELATNDAAAAARAEARLIAMGQRATASLVAYMLGESREPRTVSSILRVIAMVKDPAAQKALWPEWDKEPASRDLVIDAWAAYRDGCVSPLAGYFNAATDPQRERILDALGEVGDLAVPALRGIAIALSNEQGGVIERLLERVEDLIRRSPVVTLAKKGLVALRDLEAMAGNPSTDPILRDEAIRRIIALASSRDEAAMALQRLAAMPVADPARSLLEPAADEARLLMLSRKGEAAIDEYASIIRDPKTREDLRVGAVNGLFGLGAPALPTLRALASQALPDSIAGYLRELAATLGTQPARAGASVTPAPPPAAAAGTSGPPPDETCVGEPALTLIARVGASRRPISPRWFVRSADAAHVAFTTEESGLYRIVVATTEGASRRILAPLAHQFAPSWSWNGKRIAFLGGNAAASSPVDLNDVYISDPDGAHLRKVTDIPGAYASPAWLTHRDEILYAANRLAPPGTPGVAADALLYRFSEATGQSHPIVSLAGRIITAIEPGPDFRRVAFLGRRIEANRAADLFLHVCDTDGQGLVSIEIARSGDVAQRDKAMTASEALALGGDITWSTDGKRIATAGRVIDVDAWRIETRIDSADDSYAARSGSRTVLTGDPWCGYFGDTRQIARRCPPERIPEILADCHGALLWLDEKAHRFALFDAFNGSFGYVQLPVPATRGAPPAQRRRGRSEPGRSLLP